MEKLEEYLTRNTVEKLLAKLDTSKSEHLYEEITHFSKKEADTRDKIVQEYFGEEDIERIVNGLMDTFLSVPSRLKHHQVLDIGAGSGFFTAKVKQKFQQHGSKATFYAMDLTPAMLKTLASNHPSIVPVLGIAENLQESISFAKNYLQVPSQFDIIFSTLTLHHCKTIPPVFQSIKETLSTDGISAIIDLCKHQFEEFREEMGDVHLGFEIDHLKTVAENYFSKVHVEKFPGICCTSSGRSAELFLLTLRR